MAHLIGNAWANTNLSTKITLNIHTYAKLLIYIDHVKYAVIAIQEYLFISFITGQKNVKAFVQHNMNQNAISLILWTSKICYLTLLTDRRRISFEWERGVEMFDRKFRVKIVPQFSDIFKEKLEFIHGFSIWVSWNWNIFHCIEMKFPLRIKKFQGPWSGNYRGCFTCKLSCLVKNYQLKSIRCV